MSRIQERGYYIDVRRDKKHVYTLVYITIDKWFVFSSTYSYFIAAILMPWKRLLGAIWIIAVL